MNHEEVARKVLKACMSVSNEYNSGEGNEAVETMLGVVSDLLTAAYNPKPGTFAWAWEQPESATVGRIKAGHFWRLVIFGLHPRLFLCMDNVYVADQELTKEDIDATDWELYEPEA